MTALDRLAHAITLRPISAMTAFRVACMMLVASGLIAATGPDKPATLDTSKPTIVLAHGAFEDGSAWQAVISALQRSRYDVIAVQMPLTSLADDVQAVKRVINVQKGPVVLAGHSWGGAVITDAAAGDSRVKALVYVAAFAPDTAEVVTAFGEKYPSRLAPSVLKQDEAGFLTVDPVQFHEVFARDVPLARVRVAAATQKPIRGAAFGDSVVQAAWRSVPSWYLVTLDDQAINPQLQKFYAERMKATTREIKSSHAVIASHPDEVARLIEEAARFQAVARSETQR